MRSIRVVVVAPQSIVRHGLRAALSSFSDFDTIAEAVDGESAAALAEQLRPEIVLIAGGCLDEGALEAVRAVKQAASAAAVVLSAEAGAETVLAAIQAGAAGFLLSDVEADELAHALREVCTGRPYLHPAAARHLLAGAVRPMRPVARLTEREHEVLTLLARGLTNRAIARTLDIAEKTVSVHVSKVLGKLGVHSRTQAALAAAQSGLIAPPPLASGATLGRTA